MLVDGDPPPVERRRTPWLRFSLAGLMFAVFCWAGLWAGMHLGARRLVLNPDPAQLTIFQRTSQDVPGLNGQVRLHIGDITGGATQLTISDNTSKQLVAPLSIRRNDVVPFTVDGDKLYLFVRQLHNELIGNDYAIFELSKSDRWSQNPLVNVRTTSSVASISGDSASPLPGSSGKKAEQPADD